MTHYLYFEIEQIQRFVFRTPKLKLVRGGSALLDIFNRVSMPESIEKEGGFTVASGGGHCLASGLSRDAAQALGRRLNRQLRELTDGQVRVSFGIAPAEASWPAAWRALREDLKLRSLEAPGDPQALPPFVASCASCGVSPAVGIDQHDASPICSACEERLRHAMNLTNDAPTIWNRLRPHLGPFANEGNPTVFRKLLPERELAELADVGSGKRYLAYLYCDGNGMGRRLGEAAMDAEYGSLSRRVDDALHKAVASAILRFCPPEARTGNRFGAEVLLLGGDDLIVVLPADRAVGFTKEVLEGFFRETGEEFRLSAGLVLASPKTPITILQEVAGALLRSAKRHAYRDELAQRLGRRLEVDSTSPPRAPAKGYVDYQELTSSELNLEREKAVTCRPYRLDDWDELVRRTRAAKAARVPKGKLFDLLEALYGSEREAMTITQMVVGRTRKDAKQHAALLDLLRPCAGAPVPPRPFVTSANTEWELPFGLYTEDHRWSAVPDALELLNHLGAERREE